MGDKDFEVVFSGWLEGRNAKLPIWRRRFCELRAVDGVEMRCFSAENESRVKSTYAIDNLLEWDGQGRVFSYDSASALSIQVTRHQPSWRVPACLVHHQLTPSPVRVVDPDA